MTAEIGKRSVLLRIRRGGKDNVGKFRGGVLEGGMDDEYLEVRKNGGKPRELGDVILEDVEGLDRPLPDGSDHSRKVESPLSRVNADKPGSQAVRGFVRTNQQIVFIPFNKMFPDIKVFRSQYFPGEPLEDIVVFIRGPR